MKLLLMLLLLNGCGGYMMKAKLTPSFSETGSLDAFISTSGVICINPNSGKACGGM